MAAWHHYLYMLGYVYMIGYILEKATYPLAFRKPREEEELGWHPLGGYTFSALPPSTRLHTLRISVTFQECHRLRTLP